jgi:SNF2 family DNA or RNA helicase
MYNSNRKTIPLLFPVSEGVQLKPWFTLPLLDKGLEYIRDKRITNFHSIRNSVGALIDKEEVVALQFEKSTKLQQGFILRNSHCSQCCLQPSDKGCVHLAALFILSLAPPAESMPKVVPFPLTFAASSWFKIGSFLHEWLSTTSSRKNRIETEEGKVWKIAPDDGEVQVAVPEALLLQSRLLFPLLLPEFKESTPGKVFELLDSRMRDWEITENERDLAKTGNRSRGWQRDTSFWIWFARMLYTVHGENLPELRWDSTRNRFVLESSTEKTPAALKIILPRNKTWAFIREVPACAVNIAILPLARECFRVLYKEDNSLEVEPCLHLEDGRIMSRLDLAGNHFSNAYYLEGEGLLPTIRIPAEGSFRNPTIKSSPLPLLSFAKSEQTRDESFTVVTNDIPAFLETNDQALHHSDNIIDPLLLDMSIRDLPDRLVIESFEEKDDWCFLSLHYGIGNTSITLKDIASAREKKLNCLPGKEWLQIDKTPLSWLYNLASERLDPDGSGKIRLSYQEVIALTAIIPELSITIREESSHQRLKRLVDSSSWTDERSLADVPDHLRSYQRNGLAWLNQLYQLGIGGLLADDMGLGKTHQGLALLQAIARQGGERMMLVICPASVVLHWADKIDRFYKDLDYTVYYGSQRDLNMNNTETRGLFLTTFGVVRRDLEKLLLYSFDIILVDEIQHLKNRGTATHKAVAALNAHVKIGLTGTPVENSLQDLRSLFDICLPGFLGSKREFERHYVQPITEGRSSQARERLVKLIHPFILRRSRKQVLKELPAIIEDDRICELDDDQVSLYREVIQDREGDLDELASENGAIPYMNILALITRLKQICCHPCLVQGCTDPTQYGSGKWDLFVELTGELMSAGMKFVVFSQYVGMLELIENYLQTADIGYCSLKGSMAVGKRQKMIDQFNNDPTCRVFCASLLAGGVGIDLTSAQAVIHYDRWWNHAREEQATARVHRMGQKSVVQVFRLITRGTLEEKIHNLILKKRQLATALIQEDEAGIIKQMDRKQLADLFR